MTFLTTQPLLNLTLPCEDFMTVLFFLYKGNCTVKVEGARKKKRSTIMSEMNTSFKFFLLLIVHFLLVLHSAKGEAHIIGDSDGWSVYTDYINWVQGKTFHVGDTVVFNYEEGLHSVVQVNATAYDDCVKEPNLANFASGNDTLTLAQIGQIWYICGIGDHCENGQKISIMVLP